jgi:hypothetical protein
MRDLRRLEELSSTAALGLWADNIVLALDRAINVDVPRPEDAALLRDAADLLDAARATDEALSPPRAAKALAATSTATSVIAGAARHQSNGSGEPRLLTEAELLRAIAAILRDAADGNLTPADQERVDPVMGFFGKLGDLQLVESNSVLGSRKDMRSWTGTQTTSGFS